MRAALAIVVATLTLGWASRPILAQIPADATGFESIRMIDTLTGWAVTDRRYVGVCGKEGCLLRTTDGGANWRDATPLGSSGSKIRVWKLTALSSLVGWVTPGTEIGDTTSEIFRTTNGGRSWTSAIVPARGAGTMSFISPREGWLIAYLVGYAGHEDVEIYRSTDGGETWTKVANNTTENSGLTNVSGMTGIAFLNSATGWITGIGILRPDWLYLFVTHDGGRTWRQQNLPLPRGLTPHWAGFLQPPKFISPQDGILPVFYDLLNDSGQRTGTVAVLYTTHDSGTTWTYTEPVSVSVSKTGGDASVVHDAVADMNHAWVLDRGVLRATSDGGRRWATMPPNPLFADVTQVHFISQQVGWMIRTTFPFLMKTLDGGRTWTSVAYTILRE